MKLYKLIKYDFKNGIIHRIYSYMLIVAISAMFFFDFYLKTKEDKTVTICNFMFYIFAGKEPFIPDLVSEFIFPVVWMILYLLIAYVSLDYPYDSLTTHGIQLITRIKNRWIWWISKCLWVIESTLACFGMLYITIVILCIGFKINMTSQYSASVNKEILQLQFLEEINFGKIIMLLVVMPVVTAISVNLVQLCLGLFFKKIYCFAFTSIWLLASSYFQSAAAIGNFAMIKRSEYCIIDGASFIQGFVINGICILVVVIIGILRFRKFDILKKEL